VLPGRVQQDCTSPFHADEARRDRISSRSRDREFAAAQRERNLDDDPAASVAPDKQLPTIQRALAPPSSGESTVSGGVFKGRLPDELIDSRRVTTACDASYSYDKQRVAFTRLESRRTHLLVIPGSREGKATWLEGLRFTVAKKPRTDRRLRGGRIIAAWSTAPRRELACGIFDKLRQGGMLL
jgi:hypothetical protein